MISARTGSPSSLLMAANLLGSPAGVQLDLVSFIVFDRIGGALDVRPVSGNESIALAVTWADAMEGGCFACFELLAEAGAEIMPSKGGHDNQ
ncbi:MAG TPA: hypothetical protein VD738_03765 [Nitrospira sp.]|nr:hypothetical protein [Nitrospira sp.]